MRKNILMLKKNSTRVSILLENEEKANIITFNNQQSSPLSTNVTNNQNFLVPQVRITGRSLELDLTMISSNNNNNNNKNRRSDTETSDKVIKKSKFSNVVRKVKKDLSLKNQLQLPQHSSQHNFNFFRPDYTSTPAYALPKTSTPVVSRVLIDDKNIKTAYPSSFKQKSTLNNDNSAKLNKINFFNSTFKDDIDANLVSLNFFNKKENGLRKQRLTHKIKTINIIDKDNKSIFYMPSLLKSIKTAEKLQNKELIFPEGSNKKRRRISNDDNENDYKKKRLDSKRKLFHFKIDKSNAKKSKTSCHGISYLNPEALFYRNQNDKNPKINKFNSNEITFKNRTDSSASISFIKLNNKRISRKKRFHFTHDNRKRTSTSTMIKLSNSNLINKSKKNYQHQYHSKFSDFKEFVLLNPNIYHDKTNKLFKLENVIRR